MDIKLDKALYLNHFLDFFEGVGMVEKLRPFGQQVLLYSLGRFSLI